MSADLHKKVTKDLAKILHSEERIFSFIALRRALGEQGEYINKKPSISLRIFTGLAISTFINLASVLFIGVGTEHIPLLIVSFLVNALIIAFAMPSSLRNISKELKFSAYSKQFPLQDTRAILRDLAKTKGPEEIHKVLLSHKVDLRIKRILEESLEQEN